MVVQDVGQAGRAEVSFTVPQDDLADTLTAAQQAVDELGAGRVQHGTNVSKLSVVGLGMRTHTGVAAQMFQSLADACSQHRHDHHQRDQDLHAREPRPVRRRRPRPCTPAFACTRRTPRRRRSASAIAPAESDGHANADLEREVVAQLASMEDIVVSDVCLDTAQARVTVRQRAAICPESPPTFSPRSPKAASWST